MVAPDCLFVCSAAMLSAHLGSYCQGGRPAACSVARPGYWPGTLPYAEHRFAHEPLACSTAMFADILGRSIQLTGVASW